MNDRLVFGLLILVTVGLNTLAQIFFKIGATQTPINLYSLGGIGLYGLSTIFYILVLGKFDLSVVYPVVIGLTIVATTIAGTMLLGEKVAISHWVGLGLMLSGIGAIAWARSA